MTKSHMMGKVTKIESKPRINLPESPTVSY